MKQIDRNTYFTVLDKVRKPYHDRYLAMYSSVLGGVVTDPMLMSVPVDDHLVHRGDGIFEAFKSIDGRIYNMHAHIKRLENSARILHFKMRLSPEDIEKLVIETVRVTGKKDCLIRILISRGPGSFCVNPAMCDGPQVYITVSVLCKPFMEEHPEGAAVGISKIPAKDPFFATIKSCNYLPNALMKYETVISGTNFMVGVDEKGFITEGATENMGIVTREKALVFPRLDGILEGTTMMRVAELAKTLRKSNVLKDVSFRDITVKEMKQASEIIIVGTTINIVAVRKFDGASVGDGKPGPIYSRLNDLLYDDMRNNKKILTELY